MNLVGPVPRGMAKQAWSQDIGGYFSSRTPL